MTPCTSPLCSHSYFLCGPCGCSGGGAPQTSGFLSLCGPPNTKTLLGHWAEWTGRQPLLWQRCCLHILLPAPWQESKWQEAGLPGVAPPSTDPTQDWKPAGCALWVLIKVTGEVEQTVGVIPFFSPTNDVIIKVQEHFQTYCKGCQCTRVPM